MHDEGDNKMTSTSKKKVIVSGVTGFVGRHLIPILLENSYEVIAIGRAKEKAEIFPWFADVEFVSLDYHKCEPDFSFPKGVGLIHLAWQGLPNYSSLSHVEENLFYNYKFIKSLVLMGVGRVLAVGTCLEYGVQNGPMKSSFTPQPTIPYAVAKNTLRHFLELLSKNHPFDFQWARLFYMYGEGQSSASIIAQLDSAIERGDDVFKMSSGEQLRDYLPVNEVASQLFDLYERKSTGVYNICSGSPISIRRLVETRIEQSNSKIKPDLGCYAYNDYEPMAFWGVRDIGQTLFLPSLPNAPLLSRQCSQSLAPIQLRYHDKLCFLENEAFDCDTIKYNENYQNSQACSGRFLAHMENVLSFLKKEFPKNAKMVEVGCGKGDFVELVQKDGHFDVVGFDAAYDGSNTSIKRRYLTHEDKIYADIVVLRHVLEHIQQPHLFLAMLASVFGASKVFIEVPCLDWILKNKAFFDITYEHVNYFSMNSLSMFFSRDSARQGVFFDGQYQYIFSDFCSLTKEFSMSYNTGSWSYPSFDSLFPNISKKIDDIEGILGSGSLFVWGAATKGCVFLAHCVIRKRLIGRVEFVIDINPEKIGKFLPLSLIEIKNKECFFEMAKSGDVLLVANPAYKAEIADELKCRNLSDVIVIAL